jgi:hypothetical protein
LFARIINPGIKLAMYVVYFDKVIKELDTKQIKIYLPKKLRWMEYGFDNLKT